MVRQIILYPKEEEYQAIINKFHASGERSRSFWIIKKLLRDDVCEGDDDGQRL